MIIYLDSLLVCLLTLRLNTNIKHLSLFSFITDINGYFEIWLLHLLNLTKISEPPFIRVRRMVVRRIRVRRMVVLQETNFEN